MRSTKYEKKIYKTNPMFIFDPSFLFRPFILFPSTSLHKIYMCIHTHLNQTLCPARLCQSPRKFQWILHKNHKPIIWLLLQLFYFFSFKHLKSPRNRSRCHPTLISLFFPALLQPFTKYTTTLCRLKDPLEFFCVVDESSNFIRISWRVS